MGMPRYVLRHAGTPSGPLARFWAWMFNRANATENAAGVGALELRGAEHVLDIGFGGGASFPALLEALPEGRITGVDPVEEMVLRARRKWKHALASEKLALQVAKADDLKGAAHRFDAALTINTVYFWPDLKAGFAEVRRVLAANARFVIGVAEPELLQKVGFPGMNYRVEPAEFYAEQISAAGFTNVEVRSPEIRKPVKLVIGSAPAPA